MKSFLMIIYLFFGNGDVEVTKYSGQQFQDEITNGTKTDDAASVCVKAGQIKARAKYDEAKKADRNPTDAAASCILEE